MNRHYEVGYNLVLKTAELDVLVATPVPDVVALPAPQPIAPVYDYAPPVSVDSIMPQDFAANEIPVVNPDVLKVVALAKGTRAGRLLSAIQGSSAGYGSDPFEDPNEVTH